MTSINFTIDSVSVLNPKLNHHHHNTRLSLPHSPTFRPLLKHNRTFKLPLHPLPLNQRKPLTVTVVEPQHDSDHGEVEVEKGNDVDPEELDLEELFRQIQEVLEELREVISKKTMFHLKNMLGQLKIQVDKAKHDLDVVTKEIITEEGKECFSSVTEKEIIETFTSPVDDLGNVSGVRDFHVGMPYGYILSLGGFLSFMITGSIAAIRFGLVLGGALLALSISSMKSYKKGQPPSSLALKGQTALASILFLREIGSVGRGSNYFIALISGAVVVFYVYTLVLEGKTQKGSNSEGEAGN